MSMIIILPRKRVSLSSTLKTLASISFSTVLNSIRESLELFGDEEAVNVYLPRFHIHSDLTLNKVLDDVSNTARW